MLLLVQIELPYIYCLIKNPLLMSSTNLDLKGRKLCTSPLAPLCMQLCDLY